MENMNNGIQSGQFSQNIQQGQQPMYQPAVAHQNTVMPVNASEATNITSISNLQSYAVGTVVRFPDFAEGQPFVARVRRPSMLVLAKQGKIPNALLNVAGELFAKGGAGIDSDDKNMLCNMYDVMDIIASAALIEPSLEQIKDCGLELSDNQMLAIFNYAQAGVKALESFRKE
jgi:hypothetical protein